MSSPDSILKHQLKPFLIFKDLLDDELDLFCKHAIKEIIPKGEMFIVEGEHGDCLYLLIEGSVEIIQALTLNVSKGELDNREKALTKLDHTMHPFIGEMALFSDDDRRTANVKTLTECTFMKIMNDDLLDICNKHPETGYKVMRNLCQLLTANLVRANKNVLKLTTAFSLVLDR